MDEIDDRLEENVEYFMLNKILRVILHEYAFTGIQSQRKTLF